MSGDGTVNSVAGHGLRRSGARALTGVAILAAMVVVAACAGGPVRIPAGSSGTGVPWTPTAGRAMVQPVSAATRSCRAADLQIVAGAAGAYQGQATQEIRLTNAAGDACFMPGAPTTTLLFDDGSQQGASLGQFATSRVDLQPGQSALMLVGTPGACAGAGSSRSRVATSMALGLADGARVQVQGVYLDSQCGPPSIVQFDAGDAPAPAGVPQSVLTGSISAPQTVMRGQVLLYTVTLANPTGQAVALSPCPSYSQSLSQPSSGGIKTSRGTWLLNCAVVDTIPAGGSITFDMQLSVPGDMTAGPAKLFWDLEVASGAAVGAVIVVR